MPLGLGARSRRYIGKMVIFLLVSTASTGAASAQSYYDPCQNCFPSANSAQSSLSAQQQPTAPDQSQANQQQDQSSERSGALGGESVALSTTTMMGDLLASQLACGPLTMRVNGVTTNLTSGSPFPSVPAGAVFNFDTFTRNGVRVPAGTPFPQNRAPNPGEVVPATAPCFAPGVLAFVARGAYKIGDNESPRPQDRVFYTYNYFNNVNGSYNPGGLVRTDVHRELIGFEKTFLGGDASFGMRLPYIQVTGDGSVNATDFGDLTMILKYAAVNDRDNVLSGGLVVTAPTGAGFLPVGSPDIHPLLLQPWAGGVHRQGDFFVQGFTSLVVPLDGNDIVLFTNDYGVGYYLIRPSEQEQDRFIRYVAPSVELAINTPLNHRGSLNLPLGGFDNLAITTGAAIGVGRKSALNIGMALPITGPKPFDIEVMAQFNLRF